MTVTEKILAKASDKKRVFPGEVVKANVDVALTHDVLCGPAYDGFKKKYGDDAKVWNRRKIIVIPDHFVPNKDIPSALLYQEVLEFVKEQKIIYFYPVGENYGICHVMLPQEGHALPGTVIVGTDSHTCTAGAVGSFALGIGYQEMADVFASGYVEVKVPPTMKIIVEGELQNSVMAKDIILQVIGNIGVEGASGQAVEFAGPTIESLPMDERFTLTNMVIEANAKNGIIAPDEVTKEFLRIRTKKSYCSVSNDKDAEFTVVYRCNADRIVPVVAKPYSPENVVPADELTHIKIDQAFIGSCTGGKLHDLRIAAEVLNGQKVAKRVRLIVIPATQKIYKQALREGLIRVFLEAGAIISAPTCGPCLGGHMGVLGPGERCISSSNRNFKTRMGHAESEVYLASPKTVAASAIAGHITPVEKPYVKWGKQYVLETLSKKEGVIEEDIPPISKEMLNREFKGKAFVVHNDTDTDVIIPAVYLTTTDPKALGEHALEGLGKEYPPFQKGGYKVIVAGKNFGCGSSRGQAPVALFAAGANAVIATSFSRIFARNAIISKTILPLESEVDLSKEIEIGDEVEVNTKELKVINHTKGKEYKLKQPNVEK